ncbi:phosphotransferase family protein [Paenibacillus caui]|uniref:phosphotransferase family protein n=1 Tax=Paenibacillus caui TaxID=2873927 RepID=UPI001F4347A1|nr:phosphotransferase [Paenibacillus caui]
MINDALQQLILQMDAQNKLLYAKELTGGVSANVMYVEIEQKGDRIQKKIVREYGEIDRKRNPKVAKDEYELLHMLHTQGFAVPKPYYYALQSSVDWDKPYLVIEYVEGSTDFPEDPSPSYIFQLAEQLSCIHKLDISRADLSFLPRLHDDYGKRIGNRPETLDESLQEGEIRDVLEKVWPLPQHNNSALLHGDFWPGNVLWKNGRIAAVIDWEDAQTGDPLADLANVRLELLWAFGLEAMHSFTDHYLKHNEIDISTLPYWDLCAALRPASKLAGWGLDTRTEQKMRKRHKRFVAQAFEKIKQPSEEA